MQIKHLNYKNIPFIAYKDLFYQTEFEKLKEFYNYEPTLEGIDQAINERKNYPVDRKILVNVLEKQNPNGSPLQKLNINELASENTFTIITAHQPSLLGGPAYYFYKVFSVINLCNRLNLKYKNHFHFVPVFINGSEDHDFEEVNHLNLYNKKITWHTSQSGSVGRYHTEGLLEVIQSFSELLGDSDRAIQLIKLLNESLKNSNGYNQFVFDWVNSIFKDYGLLFCNMDDTDLKRTFIPKLKKELLERSSIDYIQETQNKLANFGFRPQAFAREINLFYLGNGNRDRIVYNQDKFEINNTSLSFTKEEILDEIDHKPENFSPNVALRPIFQESIFPNIAYIGGGGEIAYWLERKTQFESFETFFPVLIRRNSIQIIDNNIQKSLNKLNVDLELLLKDDQEMISTFLLKSTGKQIDFSKELEEIISIFDVLATKASEVDPTLMGFVKGEGAKYSKGIENIEHKVKRALKTKEETSLSQLQNLKSKLFPQNNLQERVDSFWQYYIRNESLTMDQIIEICDPMVKEMQFIYLD